MLLVAFSALVAPSIVLSAYMEPPPWSIHRASDYQDITRPTQELGLETFLKYDTSLLQDRFNGDHKKVKKWIREVVGVATKILLQLDIPVRLTPVGDIEYIKETLSPDHQTLKRLSGLRRKKLTSYFCGNGTRGNLGLAYFHSACNNLGAALNVNAYSVVSGDDVTIAGRTFAQQLGHNMGMGLDSDIPCEKPWGYMDPTINGETSWKGFWTNCSNKEFENYYMDGIGACLKENGNFIGADEDEDSLYPTYDQPTTKESLQSTTNDNDNDHNSGNGDNDNKDGNDQKDYGSGDDKDGNDEKDEISEYQKYSEEYYDEKDTDSINNDNDNNNGNDYTDSGHDYNDSGNDYNDNTDGNDEKYHDSGDKKDGSDEKYYDFGDNKDGSDEKDDDLLSDLLDGDSNDNKDANDEKDDDSSETKDGDDDKDDDSNVTKDGNGTKDNDSDVNKDGNDKKDGDSNFNNDANDEKDDDSNVTKDGNGTKYDDSNDNTDGKDEKADDYDDNTDGNNENDGDPDDNEDGNDEKDDDSIEISEYQSAEECDEYFGCNYSEEYQSGEECEINEDGYCNDDEDELNDTYYEDVNVFSEQINLVVGRGCNTGFPFWFPCIIFG